MCLASGIDTPSPIPTRIGDGRGTSTDFPAVPAVQAAEATGLPQKAARAQDAFPDEVVANLVEEKH
jgi:hypothetical protein